MMDWQVESLADTKAVAARVASELSDCEVVLLRGEMGVGKTTLAKMVLNCLGVVDEVSSPTFSVVNEYHLASGIPVYHFDFYRIDSEEEAFDLGYEDYFFSGNLCIVEWPERISGLLPEDYCEIRINLTNGIRTITLNKP